VTSKGEVVGSAAFPLLHPRAVLFLSALPTPLDRGYRFAVRQDERQAPSPRIHQAPAPTMRIEE